MKVFNVALIAVLSSIVTPHTLAGSMTNNVEWNNDGHSSSSSNGNGGFSTGTSCLQELYSHETPLTCTGPKFWESISMEAPPTCIMGESLDIEKLSLLSTFTTTAYDFSVRCVCNDDEKNTNTNNRYILWSWCSSLLTP
jgi:hypothetical protein